MPAAQALDADEILSGIRDWIQIESPTDDPAGMARMAARVQADYEAIGARVERIAGRDGFGDHLLAIDDRHCPADAAAGPGVLILSHIDTVHPIGTLAGHLPFRIEGDCAYGPGAEDMKGGTYLALAALRQIAREGLKTHLPVRHLMVSDEEMGSTTSRERRTSCRSSSRRTSNDSGRRALIIRRRHTSAECQSFFLPSPASSVRR